MKTTTNYYSFERQQVANYVPNNINTILDVGCGQGIFLHLIKEKTGAKTWGIELVEEVAENAKKNVDKVLTGKVEEVLHSITDGYFDCITFNDVLEHLLEPTEVLQLIKPKLSERGVVIASIPNVRYFFNLYELLVKKDWEYKDAGILDSTHFRFFTKKSMLRMFENAGYKIEKQDGINKITDWKFRLLNYLSLGFLNDAKYLQFVCIAKPN